MRSSVQKRTEVMNPSSKPTVSGALTNEQPSRTIINHPYKQ